MADNKPEITLLQTGALAVNTYIVKNGSKAFVVDPGGDLEDILAALGDAELDAVLLTHEHYDHFGALNELLEARNDARYMCHKVCAGRASNARDNMCMLIIFSPYQAVQPHATISDREDIEVAGMNIKAFHVPGHSPGQLCYYMPDAGVLFSGDTVFAGGIGRSDFPGGDGNLLKSKILEMLNSIPAETVVYPGHGPCSTAGDELHRNPYL